MKCSIVGCKNKGVFWFNVWFVCQDCYEKLIRRKIENEHSKIISKGRWKYV